MVSSEVFSGRTLTAVFIPFTPCLALSSSFGRYAFTNMMGREYRTEPNFLSLTSSNHAFEYRGLFLNLIALRHTALGRTPLDEGSAYRRDIYLKHNIHKRISAPRRDSNPQSHQASGRRHTPIDHVAIGIGCKELYYYYYYYHHYLLYAGYLYIYS